MIEAASRDPINRVHPLYFKYLGQLGRVDVSPKAIVIDPDPLLQGAEKPYRAMLGAAIAAKSHA